MKLVRSDTGFLSMLTYLPEAQSNRIGGLVTSSRRAGPGVKIVSGLLLIRGD